MMYDIENMNILLSIRVRVEQDVCHREHEHINHRVHVAQRMYAIKSMNIVLSIENM